MANLGSENTPIEGESFGLPSGYSFDEENGDLVIRDTDGTVAMRRADGTWELESDLALNENDISGVGAFDSESVNTEELSVTEVGVRTTLSSPQTVSSGVETKVQLDNVTRDDRGEWDDSNYKAVIAASGTFAIGGYLEWASDSNWSTGDRIQSIVKVDGSEQLRATHRKSGTGFETLPIPQSGIVGLTEGDEVELFVFQDSGSDHAIEPFNFKSQLFIARVG